MNTVKSITWVAVGGLVLASGLSLAGPRGASPMQAPDSMIAGNDDPAKMSDETLVLRANQMRNEMKQVESRVGALLKRAESKKDMVMIDCTRDKQTQLAGHAVVAATAFTGIQNAIGTHQGELRNHFFDRQTIIYQKVLVLGTQAEGCAGEDASYTGATRVDVEIDPNIPDNDPTLPPPTITTAERPPEGDCPNS